MIEFCLFGEVGDVVNCLKGMLFVNFAVLIGFLVKIVFLVHQNCFPYLVKLKSYFNCPLAFLIIFVKFYTKLLLKTVLKLSCFFFLISNW